MNRNFMRMNSRPMATVRLCGPCAFVRPRVPRVPCVSRLPPVYFSVFLPVCKHFCFRGRAVSCVGRRDVVCYRVVRCLVQYSSFRMKSARDERHGRNSCRYLEGPWRSVNENAVLSTVREMRGSFVRVTCKCTAASEPQPARCPQWLVPAWRNGQRPFGLRRRM
jgi:hypothetical protein